MCNIIGYTTCGEVICPSCARECELTAKDARDAEGNPVSVVFSTDGDFEAQPCPQCQEMIG